MQRELVIKGRSLGGCSDLTLLAPIKPGFIDSIDSVTYKTRIKRVLDVLHGARMSTHEYHEVRLLSDSIERVGQIHSVRVAVLEPEDKVLLAVTFDGSWQSYIRVLHEKVGTLLDLIFCGTVGYVTAYDHSFDEWVAWARRVQVETGFFYGPPDFTARDVLYHRRIERMRMRGAGVVGSKKSTVVDQAELRELRAVLPTAEGAVSRVVDSGTALDDDDPQLQRLDPQRIVAERLRNGLRGLSALYRLADLHRPGTDDGEVLRRAALDLLLEFVAMLRGGLATDQFVLARKGRFERQLAWLVAEPSDAKRRRLPGPIPKAKLPDQVLHRIQGGIVRSYQDVTHGLVAMVGLRTGTGARDFIAWVNRRLTRGDVDRASDGTVLVNVAFTVAGLRAVGLDEDDVELFPEEFRQGMAARAGLLGDVRNNHPRRWRLPRRFKDSDLQPSTVTPTAIGGEEAGYETVEMTTVHAVVQFHCRSSDGDPFAEPLKASLASLITDNPDVDVLAIQPLQKRSPGHFGYPDGAGQPDIEPSQPPNDMNRLHLGEIVQGHDNAADAALSASDPALPAVEKRRLEMMRDGSFLVMRKYRQFGDRLEAVVAAAVAAMQKQTRSTTDFTEVVYAKMMGRDRRGEPLVPGAGPNNFLYSADPKGAKCPLHAHIRLSHPRLKKTGRGRLPRIIRRGMSYGPAYVASDEATRDAERGLVFMAYNASISEQFEVIQRWLTGGNSTGSSSGESCPFVGVPENGLPRYFRFEHEVNGKPQVFRVQLEPSAELLAEPHVMTRLEWGLYLFAPSPDALERLEATAGVAATRLERGSVPWQATRGRQLIERLRAIEVREGEAAALDAWKAAIEDPESIDRLDSASIWAAIREDHGGVLKTPYGTLIAERALLNRVLRDDRYSVCGQRARMNECFGDVYLGMDAGKPYDEASAPINAAIVGLTDTVEKRAALFDRVRDTAARKLDAIADEARKGGKRVGDNRYEVSFDMREVVDDVLADLNEAWFGLQDQRQGQPVFRPGSVDWAWEEGIPLSYPGHFTAMSRYTFQPNPGPAPAELGIRYGNALQRAMEEFVQRHWMTRAPEDRQGNVAPLAKATFDHPLGKDDAKFIARNMVGILMGLNPTTSGAILNIVRELQRDDRFSALRVELSGRADYATAHATLDAPIQEATRMRPMPQTSWRTAKKSDRIGLSETSGVDIRPEDRIVLATVSATQQSLEDGHDDGHLMFGGHRGAEDHPMHACPGYAAAGEAIVGTLTALLARKETIRQGVGPLAFVLEGTIERPIARTQQKGVRRPTGTPSELEERNGLILAWGDSWLDYSFGGNDLGNDLRDWLERRHYTVPKDFCKWTTWTKLETMEGGIAAFCDFLTLQIQNTPKSVPPRAVLLSGGGNDSTGLALAAMIVPRKEGSTDVIDTTLMNTHMDRLEARYRTIITAVSATLDALGQPDLPILVHGYDHPFPFGQGGFEGWLLEPFLMRGYEPRSAADRNATVGAMRTIVDEFNVRLTRIDDDLARVHHVDLRGTLAANWKRAAEAWANDLHPQSVGFRFLAERVDSKLAEVSVALAVEATS